MTDKIDPNKLKTRDHLLTRIINGVTKAGIHVDRKKETNKTQTRGKKMNRADRSGQSQQANGMMLQELKSLKEVVAKLKASMADEIAKAVDVHVEVIGKHQQTISDQEHAIEDLKAQVEELRQALGEARVSGNMS